MSTYVIGDIHGALEEFQSLLYKIKFRFDGTDTLYLLGDYADWGRKSIETLLYVKKLQEACPHVYCLMGNHEWMFLSTVFSSGSGVSFNETASNWLKNNRGLVTWNGFLELPEQEQLSLVEWVRALPYKAEPEVGGKLYMLAHAYPLFDDDEPDEDTLAHRRMDTIWRRLMIREDPFAPYTGPKKYERFVCGHTITMYYFDKLTYEKDWPWRKPDKSMRNRVFFAERFIDIDCGAKCFDMTFGQDGDTGVKLAFRAQLAALRLEDEKVFYVHPPGVPGFSLEEIKAAMIREGTWSESDGDYQSHYQVTGL